MPRCAKAFLAAGVVLAAAALPARADFIVTISANGQSETYTQAGSGAGAVAEAGTATTPGTAAADGTGFAIIGATVGGYTISTTVSDNNSPGATNEADIHLTNTSVKNVSGGAGPLTITETTSGAGTYASFTMPVGKTNFTATLGAIGSTGATFKLTQDAFLVPTLETTQSVTEANGSGNVVKTVDVVTTSPFNLSQTLTLSGLAVGNIVNTTQADVKVTPTPAPPALMLAAFGLPVLGGLGWMKRRRKATSPACA
jgi:hypothetical protein